MRSALLLMALGSILVEAAEAATSDKPKPANAGSVWKLGKRVLLAKGASTALVTVAYVVDKETLYIRFPKSHVWYEYEQIPAKVWNKLTAAPSMGRYFVEKIKPKYEYSRQVMLTEV